jgi:hypothetical protein
VDRRASSRFGDERRTVRLVAIGANSAARHLSEVNALDAVQKSVDEVLPGLLAVGDDVDPGAQLLGDGDPRCIVHRPAQLLAREPPIGPKPFGLGEPCGLRQAAGDRGRIRSVHAGALRRPQAGRRLRANANIP